MYALDTNSVIDFFRGAGRVAERLGATSPESVALPAVVLYELEFGVAKSSAPEHRRAQLAALVAVTDVLPFGAAEAAVAGRIRADLERAGTPIGPIDTLIGATALSHGATLVTRNVREFGRIQGLAVESWF